MAIDEFVPDLFIFFSCALFGELKNVYLMESKLANWNFLFFMLN
jgi:hypothetical protein